MRTMKFKVEELGRHLPSKGGADIPHVVALVGMEDFLRRDAMREMIESVYGGTPPPEDVTRLEGSRGTSEKDLTALFDELHTPSLFGGERLVIVDRAQPYLDVDPDAWANAVQAGWTGVRLILVLDKLDGRRKLGKAISAKGWWVEITKPFHRPPPWKPNARPWENPLNTWIVQRARAARLKIDPPTAHLLMTRVGTSLSDLAAMIDRFETVLDPPATIDRDLVEEHTPEGEESNLFELVDTVFTGDRRRALLLAKEILHRGSVDQNGQRNTEVAGILLQFIATSLNRVRQLREVHRVVTGGGNDDAILSDAGVSKFMLSKIKAQARASGPPRLERMVGELARADEDLKMGKGPRADELLERLAVVL
ncbi:MAG: DNA polymerase III subunit delta [Planctomycetota bacterium]